MNKFHHPFLVLPSLTLIFFLLFSLTSGRAVADPMFTSEEKEWLETHPVLRVSGPKAFPPFRFVGDDGRTRGIATDFISYLADQIEVGIEIQEPRPWVDVLDDIKNRRTDVLSLAAKSPERSLYLNFTNPYLSFPMVVISRKNDSRIQTFQDLNKKRYSTLEEDPNYPVA